MIGFFSKDSGDDPDRHDDNESSDGLPYGIELPPTPRLPDINWLDDIAENARLGIPQPGFPARPLPFEEAAISLFNADMRELSKWRDQQRALLPSLYETATARRTSLEQEREVLDRKIVDTEKSIDAQRDELAEQDLKYPHASGPVNGALVLGVAVGAGLETIALQPMIGLVFATDDWKAWTTAAGVVVVIGGASWAFGGLLHRYLTYEGPVRVRHALACASIGFGLFAALALVGITAVRVLGRNADVTSLWEGVANACLLAAVQGLVQLAAMTHGWRHENPRVRELANTETHLGQLRAERDSIENAVGDTCVWADSLNEFHVGDWLTNHRAQLADDYAADDLIYRNELAQALIGAGHDEAADILHILPLPKFVPPVETDAEDDDEWVHGFMLPL